MRWLVDCNRLQMNGLRQSFEALRISRSKLMGVDSFVDD